MNRNLLIAAIVAALGSFLFGFDTAVISGTTKFITEHFQLTDATLGLTVSIALWGTVLGSFAISKPGDIFGRRIMLSVCGVLYTISALGCGLAGSWSVLLFSRLLGGVAIGAASVMAPMYIAEISPGRLRGRLVAVVQFNIVAGILAAFFSNYLLVNTGADNWRWMFGVMALPAAFFIVLPLLVPESPRWLVKKGRPAEATATLRKVGAENPDGEVADIVESLKEEAGLQTTKLFQKKYTFAIMCALLLAVFNQLSGINVIMYYAPMIFETSGSSTDSAMLQAVAVGATNMLFTIIAMFFIDRLGRKTLLLIGAVGMFISLAGAGLHYYFPGLFGGAGIVIFILGFIAFFSFSQGAVIWVFLSEIFPNKIRAKGQALASLVVWVMNAVIGLLFPIALSTLGGGAIFMFFAVMMVPFFFFVSRMMPETKGVSLEQLEKIVVRD
jgi:SP family xylose:H+ symportor-like MFS transporter